MGPYEAHEFSANGQSSLPQQGECSGKARDEYEEDKFNGRQNQLQTVEGE